MPNVGKSTLFNALTGSQVAAENFPFCTIESNVGVAFVPEPRLPEIAKITGVETQVPAVIEFVDIAGLVEGASCGEGLGNRFLGHIREMDLIAHVIGGFDDKNDWKDEIDIVSLELVLADLETVRKATEKACRRARIGDKIQQKAAAVLKTVESMLEQGKPFSGVEREAEEQEIIRNLHLLTSKPKFYILNVSEEQLLLSDGVLVDDLKAPMVTICAKIEYELAQLSEDEQISFRAELGVDVSALDNVVRTGYSLLGLQTFFTFNESEVRAWAFSRGTTAKQAAGMIHTDMEKGFIRAEVMSSEDLLSYGTEQMVKDAGRVRFEGKSYELKEGEFIRIRFNS